MGPNGMHPRVRRELADVLLSHSPSSLKGLEGQERCPRTGEKPMSLQSSIKGKKEDPGNYRPVSLTSILGKMMEELILEVIIKQVEKRRLSGVIYMDSPRGNHA